MQLFSVFCVCVVCLVFVLFRQMDVASDQECGIEASPNLLHHNPWLVYLEYFRDGHHRNIRCAATLIGARHAVTAAHCVTNTLYTSLKARLGEYDLRNEVDVKDGIVGDPIVRIPVADVITHENYNGSEHDIAILVLKEDALYTDFIRPICLPTGSIDKHSLFVAAGWGEIPTTHVYSRVKKIIPLPYWTRKACMKAYKHLNLPQGVICAGGEEGTDTCRGDSGGPLTLARAAGQAELWGVTASGNVYCGTRGSPGIYTSVHDHLKWIRRVVETTS